jgi:GNAT superfamily N-acetyltransferase
MQNLDIERVKIRKYTSEDRQTVRDICCDTGFLGNPIDPIFSDRELFADLFTKYYTDKEPESAFLAECEGEVIGYLLGCKDNKKFRRYFITYVILANLFRLIWRYFTHYHRKDRRYAKWMLFRGLRETPEIPRKAAHLHFNLKKNYRGIGIGKKLINTFLEYLRENGIDRVYGGVFSFEGKRTEELYKKLGFKIYDKKKITLWRDIIDKKAYLLRIVRDTTTNF